MRKQNGMSLIGWLFIITTIGFYITLTVKLLPIYLDNYTVKNILQDLQSRPEITTSRDSIATAAKTYIQKSFAMNNISNVKAEDIKITPIGDGADIDASYEVRVNMIGNIDAIVKFNNIAKVRFGGEK